MDNLKPDTSKAKYKIDFENIKGDKLFFYEKRKNNSLVEYAYIVKNDDEFIYFKPEEDIEEHEFPKDDFNEFMILLYKKISYEKYGNKIDRKSKSSTPMFKIKIINKKIEVIVYLSIQLGFINALKFAGIKYRITDKKEADNVLPISTKSEELSIKYLNIFPETPYQEYIVNGLRNWKKKINLEEGKLNSVEIWESSVNEKFGEGTFQKLREYRDKFIDGTTEKILKSYNYSTDLVHLLGKTMPKMILNAKVDDQNDLNTKRIRMGEAIAHQAYNQIQQAVVNFKKQRNQKNPQIMIKPYEVIKNLISSGMLQWTTPINPLDELNTTMKITKSGIGNPKNEQIVLDKRDINETYFGTISPTTTNEYGGIGLNQTLTNRSMITDRFGSILTKKFSNDSNPFENLSFVESLTPFFERDDTTRRVMGNQQTTQFVQVDNPDVPLVQTSFESLIPYIVSDKFAIKAKKKGKVKVNKDHIHIFYSDGTEEIYSTKPSKARTKRGLYIPLEYNVLVKDGQNVIEEQLLAVTNSMKNGKLGIGKNLVVAEMSYRGMNYEDGWVVTEDINEKYKSKIYDKIVAIVPENVNITKLLIDKNRETKPGDILIEYQTDKDEYLDYDDEIDSETEEDLTVGKEIIGNKVRYRSIGGKIADVVIKLNSKKIDKHLLFKWEEQVNDIKKKFKICAKLKNTKAELDCRDNIEFLESVEIGGHKANKTEPEGAIIEIYIEKENPIRNGSKFTLGNSGGKGTVQYTIPKDKKPKTAKTGLEIDFIATPLSIISRKNPSILLQLYSGKVIYFLNKKAQDLILSNKINEAKKLLTDCFEVLDVSEDRFIIDQLNAFLKNSNDFLVKYVKRHDPLNNPAFPLIVPPYKNKIGMEEIEKVAKILDVPLQEKVIIPEEDSESEYEVTVGIMQVHLLEHFPKAMSGVRGSINAKAQTTLGQGRSGTKEGNGAIKIGVYDMFSLIAREPDELFKELWIAKADNTNAKRQLSKKILNSDEPVKIEDIELDDERSITKKLIKAYFYGAMLEPQM